MSIKEIKEMISLMNENNLNELEMERDGLRIKLKKGAGGVEVEHIIPHQAAPHTAVQSAATTGKNRIEVKSPMVGTFYRAPSPESPSFAEAGSRISVGQVICIIEAMKLMNEIKAEVSGKVVEILAENGQAIEFGQVLFVLEAE